MFNELLLNKYQFLKVLGPVQCSPISAGSNVEVDLTELLSKISYNCLCLIVVNAVNHSSYNAIISAYLGPGYIHAFCNTLYSNNLLISRSSGTKINIKNTNSSSTNTGIKVQLIQLSY